MALSRSIPLSSFVSSSKFSPKWMGFVSLDSPVGNEKLAEGFKSGRKYGCGPEVLKYAASRRLFALRPVELNGALMSFFSMALNGVLLTICCGAPAVKVRKSSFGPIGP